MRPQLSPTDLHDFNHVYGDPPEVGLFSDLMAVHELAHLYHAQSGFWFPQRWLSELFANLALEGWVREREPASLPALRTVPRCFATIDSTRFAVTALERMDQALDARPDGPIIYAWYQCTLHCRARRVWDAAGPGVLAGLHERFRDSPPVTDLRAFLVADLDPVFGAVIDAWPSSAPRAPDAGESGGPDRTR